MRIIKTPKTPVDCPSKIPWILLWGHDRQAWKNHGQTLKRLNERGGVSILELYAILRDSPFDRTVPETEAVEYVNDLVGPGRAKQ